MTNDDARQKNIEGLGLKFLRFDEREVRKDMNNVLRTIEAFIDDFEVDL